ncbi:MAG: hypothetical protein ACRDYA_12860 [Egibacteraceae bacterium]
MVQDPAGLRVAVWATDEASRPVRRCASASSRPPPRCTPRERGWTAVRPDLSLAEAERVAFALWVAADAADLDDGAFADLLAKLRPLIPPASADASNALGPPSSPTSTCCCAPSAPWWRRSTTPSPTRSPPWTGGSRGRSP